MECLIRFYEELNFFLPDNRKKTSFKVTINSGQSVKDLIESLGIPHTEIDLILVNGESVDFSFKPKDGDNISVYPVFESLDISYLIKLRPEPLRETKFIIDVHLGKLAKNLRMLGFDTLYSNKYTDSRIAEISSAENRIVLTRDRGLLKRSIITRGYIVRSDSPNEQLNEILDRFDLKRRTNKFSRCIDCNGILVKVDKKEIISKLKPKTIKYFDEFKCCYDCGKIYWKGSHYNNMFK